MAKGKSTAAKIREHLTKHPGATVEETQKATKTKFHKTAFYNERSRMRKKAAGKSVTKTAVARKPKPSSEATDVVKLVQALREAKDVAGTWSKVGAMVELKRWTLPISNGRGHEGTNYQTAHPNGMHRVRRAAVRVAAVLSRGM